VYSFFFGLFFFRFSFFSLARARDRHDKKRLFFFFRAARWMQSARAITRRSYDDDDHDDDGLFGLLHTYPRFALPPPSPRQRATHKKKIMHTYVLRRADQEPPFDTT
jgi:hypothetical protein